MTLSKLIIAAAAGVASALLFAGLVLQSGSAVTLALAAPIPIFIASLGWGSVAGFVAAIVSAIVVASLSGIVSGGVLLFVSMTLPAAITGHLVGLARPVTNPTPTGPFATSPANSQPQLMWYPLERVLFAVAAMAALACVTLGWYLGYDVAALKPDIVDALSQSGNASQMNAVEIEAVAALLLTLVPLVQPAVLTLTLGVGLYLAAFLTRISNRLPRPKDDLPTSLQLPPLALVIFGVGLAGASFLSGSAEHVALVLCGAFGMAFTFVGLARLHARTRGRSNRGLLLFVSYAAILILSFPLFVFTCLGVYDTVKRMRRPPPA